MPSFISKDGVWTPKTEKVALKNKDGEPMIYEGPDRAATDMLKESGEDHLGMHFTQDPDIINRAHERKQTIEEFTQQHKYTKEVREKQFKENAEKKVLHELPKKRPAKKQSQTGGVNTANPKASKFGGFSEGDPMDEAVKSVA